MRGLGVPLLISSAVDIRPISHMNTTSTKATSMRRVARRIESFSSSTAFCYGFNDRQQRIISNGCTRRSITVAALKTAQKKKPTRSWRKFLQKGKITLPKISVSHLTLPRIPQVETNTLPIVATVGNYIFRSVVLLSRKSIFARLGYARS